MSQDQIDAPAQTLERRPLEPATETQHAEGHADSARPSPEEGRPVKAGRAILLLVVAAIAVAYSGITGRRHDEEKLKQWTQERAISSVAVVTPQSGGESRELVLPGDVDAFYSASIHSQVMGYVQEWRKDIGARVKQGDVLAVVDTPELDDRVAVAQSELAKAKANSGAGESDGGAVGFPAPHCSRISTRG